MFISVFTIHPETHCKTYKYVQCVFRLNGTSHAEYVILKEFIYSVKYKHSYKAKIVLLEHTFSSVCAILLQLSNCLLMVFDVLLIRLKLYIVELISLPCLKAKKYLVKGFVWLYHILYYVPL